MKGAEIISITDKGDERGDLYIAEYQKELPFVVRRVYYICNVHNKNTVRGYHAHKKLQQVMVCLGGSCDIVLDDGYNRETIRLDNPGKALYLKPGLWREMKNFSDNSTLMVFASEEYDEMDYIRNYDDYRKYRGIK